MVTRLSFTVPEFLQTIWVSPEARTVWESRINAISRAWFYFERLAVLHEIKPLTLQHCAPADLPELMMWGMDNGLEVVPLRQEGISAQGYSNAAKEFDPTKPWSYRVVIGDDLKVYKFLEVWKKWDEIAIGDALGFPPCCQAFFNKYWVKEGWRDLTYPMVLSAFGDSTHYRVHGPSACNILLRWLGVRMVSHLPCNFQCEDTARVGNDLMWLFKNHYPNEYGWIQQILEWPIRWDSLHGIAVIITPIVKIVTSTDALSERVIVDRKGLVYPSEGASGVEFPFKVISPIKFYKQEKETEYTDNGFSSKKAMLDAHEVVLKVVKSIPIDDVDNIVDLGCGNGILLEKIAKLFPDATISGVEIDPDRHKRAAARLMGKAVIIRENIQNILPLTTHNVVLISANRLLEIGDNARYDFFKTASHNVKYLIIYKYGGDSVLSHTFGWFDYFQPIQHDVFPSTEVVLLKSENVHAIR